jgi:uncharacterized membrane protein YgcG
MAKFVALPLAPLYAAGERSLLEWRAWRGPALFAAAFGLVCAVMLVHPAIDPGLATFWDRTVRSQIERESPFSIWGQEPSLDWVQLAVTVLTVVLAIAVAFVPRRRAIPQIAAVAAAVVIAIEAGADHWFYLYIPWFAPLVLIAIAAQHGGRVAFFASGYEAGTDIPSGGGVMETEPNEAQLDDPTEGDGGDEGGGDTGGEESGGDFGGGGESGGESGGGESAGESEAPTGP